MINQQLKRIEVLSAVIDLLLKLLKASLDPRNLILNMFLFIILQIPFSIDFLTMNQGRLLINMNRKIIKLNDQNPQRIWFSQTFKDRPLNPSQSPSMIPCNYPHKLFSADRQLGSHNFLRGLRLILWV